MLQLEGQDSLLVCDLSRHSMSAGITTRQLLDCSPHVRIVTLLRVPSTYEVIFNNNKVN